MEIKRPEPGEEPEQITLDVKDENSGTTISIDTVISPRKMTYEETMSCFDRAFLLVSLVCCVIGGGTILRTLLQ